LHTTPSHWTVEQIAAQFTGKNTKKKLAAIVENLERLEWFGLVIAETHGNQTIWHHTESTKTA